MAPCVLVAGERRKYSAIAAGLATIPVHVRHGMSAVHQVAGMLVENHDREDLTPVEFAAGIQQLAGMEGVTTKAITEMTGVKAAEVKKAVKVATSEVASAVAERHGLTLDQAVVLAEFEDDKGAVILLTQTAAQGSRAAGPTWSASSDRSATTPRPSPPSPPSWKPPGPRWSNCATATGSPKVPSGWTS